MTNIRAFVSFLGNPSKAPTPKGSDNIDRNKNIMDSDLGAIVTDTKRLFSAAATDGASNRCQPLACLSKVGLYIERRCKATRLLATQHKVLLLSFRHGPCEFDQSASCLDVMPLSTYRLSSVDFGQSMVML